MILIERWSILDTNGAPTENSSPIEGGGILMDYSGEIIVAFAKNLGACISFRT